MFQLNKYGLLLTSMKNTLFRFAASKTNLVCFKLSVIGFSQRTCLPAFISLIHNSAWVRWIDAT